MVNKIVELCKDKGITIAELERQANLAQRTVYKWDKNVPSVDKVIAVANVLGTTVEELSKEN